MLLGIKSAPRLLIHLIFLLTTFLSNSPLSAQPSSEELKSLQNQIESLKETQRAMQKELQEIKALLQGRAGAPNQPPQNLKVRVGNSPFKGEKTAKLTLVEFTDYQCPFCRRFFKETFPSIEREYIATGKLKYVLRDFPLEVIHREAFKAHEAANCAGEQGKYWEMHDRLFENQSQLGGAELLQHARAVGLNLPVFQRCLDSGQQAAVIRKSAEEGRSLGVDGTPTFFLGVEDSGSQNVRVLRMIVGAQPYAQFKEAIESALSEGRK